MSSNGDNHDKAVDALIGALMHYIDEATPAELEQFAGRGADRASIVSSARVAVGRAVKEVAQERRDRTQQRMRSAASIPPTDVSALSLPKLRAILAAHVANDDASATMAARHENGEMDEAELRSVVADILRLRQQE